MSISRSQTVIVANAQPDDFGNVEARLTVTPLTPAEAREFARELQLAAAQAEVYRLEQANQEGPAS
jgi:hypothetical protein